MLELILRIGFSLLIVFGLMWAIAKVVKRPLAGRGAGALSVLARQQLTRSSSVAVVRVADRALVLGVTDGQVNLLTETDLAAMERQLAGPETTVREPVELGAGPVREPALVGTGPVHPAPDGRLAGSVLAPATWRHTVNFLRDRTARR